MSRKTPPLAALVVAILATAAPAVAAPSLREPVEVATATAPTGPPAVEVLRAWDTRRADAWSHGDLAALTGLYTQGSVAGRRDRAMLRAWVARGLVVQGLRTQLLTVRAQAHTPSTWTLRVTDRLVGGVAVGPGLRRPLPRDEATTRTVRLRLVAGGWLVASVRPEEVTPQAD